MSIVLLPQKNATCLWRLKKPINVKLWSSLEPLGFFAAKVFAENKFFVPLNLQVNCEFQAFGIAHSKTFPCFLQIK